MGLKMAKNRHALARDAAEEVCWSLLLMIELKDNYVSSYANKD